MDGSIDGSLVGIDGLLVLEWLSVTCVSFICGVGGGITDFFFFCRNLGLDVSIPLPSPTFLHSPISPYKDHGVLPYKRPVAL